MESAPNNNNTDSSLSTSHNNTNSSMNTWSSTLGAMVREKSAASLQAWREREIQESLDFIRGNLCYFYYYITS